MKLRLSPSWRLGLLWTAFCVAMSWWTHQPLMVDELGFGKVTFPTSDRLILDRGKFTRLLDAQSGRLISEISELELIGVLPNRNLLIAQSQDEGVIHCISLRDGKTVRQIQSIPKSHTILRQFPPGLVRAHGYLANPIEVFNLDGHEWEPLRRENGVLHFSRQDQLSSSHDGGVLWCPARSESGDRLPGDQTSLIDSQTGEELGRLPESQSDPIFSKDNRRVLHVDKTNTTHAYDLKPFSKVSEISQLNYFGLGLGISPDGNFAYGGFEGLYETNTGQRLYSDCFLHPMFSPDNRHVAFSCDSAFVFDLQVRQVVQCWPDLGSVGGWVHSDQGWYLACERKSFTSFDPWIYRTPRAISAILMRLQTRETQIVEFETGTLMNTFPGTFLEASGDGTRIVTADERSERYYLWRTDRMVVGFWTTALAVLVGNLIIHRGYRYLGMAVDQQLLDKAM